MHLLVNLSGDTALSVTQRHGFVTSWSDESCCTGLLSSCWEPDLLKAEVMKSHGCSKFVLRQILTFERKPGKTGTIFMFHIAI